MVKEWNVVRDDAQAYLYAYYDDNWVSYDDVSMVSAKVRLYSPQPYSSTLHDLSQEKQVRYHMTLTQEGLSVQIIRESRLL
jgi:hypothetical protein